MSMRRKRDQEMNERNRYPAIEKVERSQMKERKRKLCQ
jgi:hypothetical protein